MLGGGQDAVASGTGWAVSGFETAFCSMRGRGEVLDLGGLEDHAGLVNCRGFNGRGGLDDRRGLVDRGCPVTVDTLLAVEALWTTVALKTVVKVRLERSTYWKVGLSTVALAVTGAGRVMP